MLMTNSCDLQRTGSVAEMMDTDLEGSACRVGRENELRARVAGTTIDQGTLLSTDYFNSFNEVVMLLGMVADAPEVIDDIRAWKFRTYEEHFLESGLSFGPLAIEAYAYSAPGTRAQFEDLIKKLYRVIVEACAHLKPASSPDELARLKLSATEYSQHLQSLIETGSGIVHGFADKIDQSAIDKLF